MNFFIGYSKEDDVEEMVGEVDQTPNDENKEPVEIEIEIVKGGVDNPSDENYSIILEELDDEEEEKEGRVEKDFHILKFDEEESELIEFLQEELDGAVFPKRVRGSDLHKFYEIRYQKSNLIVKYIHTKRGRDLFSIFYKLFFKIQAY